MTAVKTGGEIADYEEHGVGVGMVEARLQCFSTTRKNSLRKV